MTYTTQGSARGNCGHEHATIRAAVQCLLDDQNGCKGQGGYSDRHICHMDGTALSDAECQEIGQIEQEILNIH